MESKSKERTLGTRASIFKKTDKVIPELEQPAVEPPKQRRIKATFYLTPDDVLSIDGMQSEEFRQTGKKPERSHIVSRAIQVLKAQAAQTE